MYLAVVLMLAMCGPSTSAAPGELTDAEQFFQGEWQYYVHGSGIHAGTLQIEGRRFTASILHGDYTGTVEIRPDLIPAQIDFTIENCGCKFEGMTSRAIYREEEGSVTFAARAPGEVRPESLEGLDPSTHEITRLRRELPGELK